MAMQGSDPRPFSASLNHSCLLPLWNPTAPNSGAWCWNLAGLPKPGICPPLSPPYLHKAIQRALIELRAAHYCPLVHHPCPHHVHRVGGNGPSQPTRKTGTTPKQERGRALNTAVLAQTGLDISTRQYRSLHFMKSI